MKRDIDPITLSTVWHGFQSIGREMRYVVDRTAQSYLIAQLHDMAAGIWDAKARTIAVPEGPTSMFLSQKFSVEYILDKFKGVAGADLDMMNSESLISGFGPATDPFTGRELQGKIPYAKLGLKPGQAVRISARKGAVAGEESFFPDFLLALK